MVEKGVIKKKKKRNIQFGTAISEDRRMLNDLLNILTYMSAIVTANIRRDTLFELAGRQEGLASKYFKQIHLLATNYGYDYTTACKIVANEANHPAIRDFLIRLSNALSTGEEEEVFLKGELDRQEELYTSKYLGELEEMRKWTDGYAALLVSVVMIVAVFLIGSMIFSMGDIQTTGLLVAYLLSFVSVMGVYIIHRVSPYEKIVHTLDVKSKEQILAIKLGKFLLPIIVIAPIILIMIGVDNWLIFLTIGVVLAPIGVLGMKDANNIEKRDRDISTFFKGLGTTAGIQGSTISMAMNAIDDKSVGSLEKFVVKLRKRLGAEIKPGVCWYLFKGETGSELINHSTTVFIDAVELGGDAKKIGAVVAQTSLGVSLMREKRKLIAGGFLNLVVPLHAAMGGVLMFIYQVIFQFNNAMGDVMGTYGDDLSSASSSMPMGMGFFDISSSANIEFISNYVAIVICILVICNTLAVKATSGGSIYKTCQYASMLFIVSALILYVVPLFADLIFKAQVGG